MGESQTLSAVAKENEKKAEFSFSKCFTFDILYADQSLRNVGCFPIVMSELNHNGC